MKQSIDAQIEEVEYELVQRRDVYARLAVKHPSRRSTNELHMDRMRAVLATLRWLKDNEAWIKGGANGNTEHRQAAADREDDGSGCGDSALG